MAFTPSLIEVSTPLIGYSYNPDTKQTIAQVQETERLQSMIRFGKKGHYGYPKFPSGSNVGGDWCIERHDFQRGLINVGKCYATSPYAGYTYSGALVEDCSFGTPWDRLFPVDNWGPMAYRRMKPTKPEFSGLNSLYELKDIPGMIRHLREGIANLDLRSASSWHLALQFGWKPLLNDIVNLVNLQRRAQERLKQLLRDNGKPVRRRVILQDTLDGPYVTDGLSILPRPYLVNYFYHGQPRTTQTWEIRDKVWASAQFRFWLPDGPRDVKWEKKMLNRLYGGVLSPSVAYNAIPWSWMIDWFTSVGDVIENSEAGVADRCAADYFYVMRKVEYIMRSTTTIWLYDSRGVPYSSTGTSQQTSSVKTRGRGDPFGWGVNPNSLDASQLAILGALGMSRLR